jgi:hypothetical protein
MVEYMNIVFFNHFHNGDLHISREFIRKIIDKVLSIDNSVKFSYAHSNDPCLLSDILNLNYIDLKSLRLNQFENLNRVGDTVFINTWYAQQKHKYMNIHGMTLDCLYEAFNDTCKSLWGFSLDDISSDPSSFIPTIDYSKFEIQKSQNWLNNNPQKKIFVSNGLALSGQAENFLLTPIINELAKQYPQITFILSNKENCGTKLSSNVIYSTNIIGKSGSDLNENSFITTYCDVIIGRASGVFSYAWTQQNLLQRNIKFVCFCGPGVVIRNDNQFWTSHLLTNKIKYSAEFIVSHETNGNIVKNIIEKSLF